ncbi:SubName: Full=Uncharacterized protein {ECO:0000313/EMBL:CCA73864.1} [Serendipita indica DSM 11827]|nr:SubName: Full=Uncharacterized protein {ECO:0000313/EMBL:CCA73864.1} [Serendipita indica DSM 11827]
MSSYNYRTSSSPPPYQEDSRLLCLGEPTTPLLQPIANHSILDLDGGGTRTICQLFILGEVTHRLAWDMGLIDQKTPHSVTQNLAPADFFDEIGAGGMGAFVAFLLTCGLSVEAAREHYMHAAPRIVHALSVQCIESILEDAIQRSGPMCVAGEWTIDSPSCVNVWLPRRASKQASSMGSESLSFRKIPAGSPLRRKLLPLVAAEMFRELSGQVDTLHYTLPFARSVCPNSHGITLLLSLGSGDIPESTRTAPVESTSSSWIPSYVSSACSQVSRLLSNTQQTPSTTNPLPPNRPALPSTKQTSEERRALNKYLPSRAFGRTFIRLNPNFSMWTQSRQEYDPTDWESTKFGEHKMLTSNYCSKADTAALIDTAVAALRSCSLPLLPPLYPRIPSSRHDSLQSEYLAYESAGFY